MKGGNNNVSIFAIVSKQNLNVVYLLLGGNLGDTAKILLNTLSLIDQQVGRIVNASSCYESEAWGFESENTFLNQVVVVETPLGAMELLDGCHKIELELGRIRTLSGNYQSRIIDIDILLFNDAIIKEDRLSVPHPRMSERKFTMLPLVEISPKLIHPVSGKTMLEILNDCNDSGRVEMFRDRSNVHELL